MTRDEIINLAISAGFHFFDAGHAPMLHTTKANYSEEYFERFAALIAAAERAKLYALPGAQPAPSVPEGWIQRGMAELEAIRSRQDDDTLLDDRTLIERIGKAMLAAAPEAKP